MYVCVYVRMYVCKQYTRAVHLLAGKHACVLAYFLPSLHVYVVTYLSKHLLCCCCCPYCLSYFMMTYMQTNRYTYMLACLLACIQASMHEGMGVFVGMPRRGRGELGVCWKNTNNIPEGSIVRRAEFFPM